MRKMQIESFKFDAANIRNYLKIGRLKTLRELHDSFERPKNNNKTRWLSILMLSNYRKKTNLEY